MSIADLRAAAADARADAAKAESALGELRAERAATRANRDAALARADDAGAAKLDVRLTVLDGDLADARTRLEQARQRLEATRLNLLHGTTDPFTLTSARHPLLMLPVRLETRYAWADPKHPADPAAFSFLPPAGLAGQPVLLVRIYPDTIHQDSHEPELTPNEMGWQADFRKRIMLARDRQHFVDAWAQLIARAGARRAAYLAHTVNAPPAGVRADLWTRAARATGLPDFWHAEARLADGQIRTSTSGLVAWPLETGPDPAGWSDPGPQPAPGGPGMAWMTDFAAALRSGMALRLELPLEAGGVPARIERLAVVGSRVETDAAGGAATLRGLLDAHHYTAGLWLPAHGTPTNGTPLGRAPTARPGSTDEVYRVEGDQAPLNPPTGMADVPGSAGFRAAELLGLENATFAHVADADAQTARLAELVRLLLACAFAGPLTRLLDPGLTRNDADLLVSFFVGEVLAAGPLPTVRVADQPYGILPVTMVDPNQADLVNDSFLNRVTERLGVLRSRWAEVRPAQVGDIGASAGDPAVDLVEILRNTETTATVGIRAVLGPQLAAMLAPTFDPGQLAQIQTDLSDLLARLGLTGQPELLGLLLAPDLAPVTKPLVQPESPGQPIETAAEYFRLLGFERHPVGDFTLSQLASDTDAGYAIAGGRPGSLLFEIGRLAIVSTADQAARERLLAGGSVASSISDHWDDELPPARPPGGPSTIADRLEYPDPQDPRLPLGFVLLTSPGGEAARLWSVIGACRELARLAPRPAELERVLRNELGLLWHRLDAWYTALATRRLSALRDRAQTGINLGGYGVVTDLRSGHQLTLATTAPPDRPGPVYDDAANGGYVHAPSLPHAVTAAVLRSAHLGHVAAGHGEAFSVDLSSARVRRALALLDGIAQGQPLAALLGYRIERALKQAAPDGPAAIAVVRAAAPVVAGKLTPLAASADPGLVAANNVVDGRRLLELAGFGAVPRVDRAILAAAVPALTSKQLDAVVSALVEAGDVLDAAADLLLAEGVFQLVQGNPARSGAAGDALSGTPVPPGAIDIAQTPRHGIGLTQRIALACPILTATDLTDATGWAATPRAQASPIAEAFVRSVLPSPEHIRLRAELSHPDGSISEIDLDLASLHARAADAKRTELQLGALDLVFATFSHQPETEPGGSALELRLLEMLGLTDAAAKATDLTLILERGPGWDRADFDLVPALEIARSLRALLAEARPLRPADLGQPQTAASHQIDSTGVDAALLVARTQLAGLRGDLVTAAAGLRADLSKAVTDGVIADSIAGIDPAAVRMALHAADRVGVAQACPAPWHPVEVTTNLPTTVRERVRAALTDLLVRAAAVQAELDRRLTAETAAGTAERAAASDPADAQAAGAIAVLVERAEAMFGRGFPLAIPLAPSMPGADALLSAAAQPHGTDAASARQVLARAALVRPGAARLDAVLACGEITGAVTPEFAVHQQPHQPGEPWIALPGVPAGGRISLLASLPLGTVTGGNVAGFLVDEWVEVVPDAEQTTSVAFHYDTPTSAAPNVWLLGVLPPGQENWTTASAVAYVDEALELAKLRAVGSDAIPVLGQLLPAAYGWDLNPNQAGLDVVRLTEPAKA